MTNLKQSQVEVAIIGGGPAGLMAAEVLLAAGHHVALYDAMLSVGRKFLIAGKGGLNLTHSEPLADFLSRFGDRQPQLTPYLQEFDPTALRTWVKELGFETFVGTSGRVFPEGMNAGEILHAWRTRLLASARIEFHMQHEWLGWAENGDLRFATKEGQVAVSADATILALGGASWPQLGSTGTWVELLHAKGVAIAPLQPANCGFDVAWSDHFKSKFNGEPIKPVTLTFTDVNDEVVSTQGEFIISADGVEGSLIYAFSAAIRSMIAEKGEATIYLDLAPDWDEQKLVEKLSQPRGSRSFSSHFKKTIGLQGVKLGLIWEFVERDEIENPQRLARAIKHLPTPLLRPRPIAEAISTAGGVKFEGLTPDLMLEKLPGVFCAGEMLDWEAPTGGYLLTASFATGRAAGLGAAAWLAKN